MATKRDEHLEWAKGRALAELEPGGGGPAMAIASVQSDFMKFPELSDHLALGLMAELAFAGHLTTAAQVREFVEGIQ